MMRFWLLLALSIAAATSFGCSRTASCESLCSSAQSGKCTTITGDCGIFCASLVNVATEGSCLTQYDAYEACLNQGAVCTATPMCTGQQTALSNCTGVYCLEHIGNTDCTTLTSAHQ